VEKSIIFVMWNVKGGACTLKAILGRSMLSHRFVKVPSSQVAGGKRKDWMIGEQMPEGGSLSPGREFKARI